MSNYQGLLFNLSPAFGHFSIVKFPFLNSFVSESPLNLYKEGIFLWLATDWDAGVWLAAVEQVRSLINLCSLDPPSVSTPQLWSVQQFVTFLAGTLWEGRKEGRLYNSSSDLFVSILDKDLSCHSPGLGLQHNCSLCFNQDSRHQRSPGLALCNLWC